MAEWDAFIHAMALPYRNAEDGLLLDELLSLLAENDFHALKHARSAHVRGTKSWARLAGLAVELIRRPLVRGGLAVAREAYENAHLLEHRLAQRDTSTSARVTSELRERITRLARLASAVRAAVALQEGETPTDASVGHLLGLHQRWFALRDEEPADQTWVVDLVNAAAARVLQSGAHGALKGLAGRAAAQWTPEPAEPPPKRTRVEDSSPGVSLTWDSDDDFG